MNECDRTPDCFIDSDCGKNYLCSEHHCVYFPVCTTTKNCPNSTDWTCYKGRCIPLCQ